MAQQRAAVVGGKVLVHGATWAGNLGRLKVGTKTGEMGAREEKKRKSG